MPLIELDDIHKIYQLGQTEVAALCGVSLTVDGAEFVAVMGPSGSGKSTLMNTLGCLDRPTRGTYSLDGEEVSKMSANGRADLRNRKIGFVFQNFNLLARTSALENVELPLLYSRHVSPRQRRKRAKELLERVGLGDRMDHHPGQLSGGQQQRVAIARALVNEPAILMADEPTGNLDSRTSSEVMRLLCKLNDEGGITLVIVTHEQVVARHAKRILILRDGLVECDTSDFSAALHALHGPETVGYGGSPGACRLGGEVCLWGAFRGSQVGHSDRRKPRSSLVVDLSQQLFDLLTTPFAKAFGDRQR